MRSLALSLLSLLACTPPQPAAPIEPAPPAPAPAPAAEPTPPRSPEPPEQLGRLLVMPLRAESGLEASARALDEMILEAIDDLDRYEVLGPEDLNAVLGVEALKDAMGCDDVSCAAELGGALGAPFLVAGQLTELGTQTVLSLRLMDTRAAAVLERATARGPATAEALATMMAAAVGDLFGAEVEVAAPTMAPVPQQATVADYREYTALMQELGRLTSNNEYSRLLERLDSLNTREITVPDSVDLDELLVYYRVLACNMLKRHQCVRTTVADYKKRWPMGTYTNAVQAFLDQLDDAQLQRDAKADEVDQKLAGLRDSVKRGLMKPLAAKEAAAAILFSGRRYTEAAAAYTELVRAHKEDPEKVMDLVGMLAMALEYAGDLARARQVLENAQRRHPKLFRLEGLHHRLRSLPR